MTQRRGLARVLLHDPQVLLLDEPASGFDPRASIEIRGLLKELRNMGKTIMVSSHILPELADLGTSIRIIEQGELLYHGSVAEALRRARVGVVVHVKTPDDQERARLVLEGLDGVESAAINNGMLVVNLQGDTTDFGFIARAMLDNDLRIHEIKQEEVNLETAFMRLTKGIVQ